MPTAPNEEYGEICVIDFAIWDEPEPTRPDGVKGAEGTTGAGESTSTPEAPQTP